MKNIKFLIIESNKEQQNYVIEKLKTNHYQNISLIDHPNELDQYSDEQIPDFMICNYKSDINYSINDVLEKYSIMSKVPCIIYSLQYDDIIFKKLNSVNLVDFLPMNMSDFELEKAIQLGLMNNMSRTNLKNKFNDYILVRSGKEVKKIKLSEIMYIGVDGKYIELHTSDRRYFIRFTLSSILDKLPDNFVKIHKAYVINTDYLDTINIEDNTIRIGKENLPMSRSYKKELFDKYYVS